MDFFIELMLIFCFFLNLLSDKTAEKMSFKEAKETIECGDVVILYLNPSNMHAIEVIEKIKSKNGELVDNVFQTTYGSLKVISLVGKQYGTKIQLSKGWAYVLQPTPELWTVSVRHRTQIIYTPDISLITHLLELNPGKIVIETGTLYSRVVAKVDKKVDKPLDI